MSPELVKGTFKKRDQQCLNVNNESAGRLIEHNGNPWDYVITFDHKNSDEIPHTLASHLRVYPNVIYGWLSFSISACRKLNQKKIWPLEKWEDPC